MSHTFDKSARRRAVPNRMGRLFAKQNREDGFATAELVIATPLMLLLVMGVIQFGLLWHAQQVAQTAASQAVNTARAQHSSAGAGQMRGQQFLNQTAAGDLDSSQVTVTRGATQVTADVTGQAASVIPGWHPTVHAHAAGPVENFNANP